MRKRAITGAILVAMLAGSAACAEDAQPAAHPIKDRAALALRYLSFGAKRAIVLPYYLGMGVAGGAYLWFQVNKIEAASAFAN